MRTPTSDDTERWFRLTDEPKWNNMLNSKMDSSNGIFIPKFWFKSKMENNSNFSNSNRVENENSEGHIPEILTTLKGTNYLTHVYISRIGDNEKIKEIRTCLAQCTHQELVDKYNAIEKLFGVHQQALNIIALNLEFIKRFNKTPINIEENCLISLGTKIVYSTSLNTIIKVQEN